MTMLHPKKRTIAWPGRSTNSAGKSKRERSPGFASSDSVGDVASGQYVTLIKYTSYANAQVRIGFELHYCFFYSFLSVHGAHAITAVVAHVVNGSILYTPVV